MDISTMKDEKQTTLVRIPTSSHQKISLLGRLWSKDIGETISYLTELACNENAKDLQVLEQAELNAKIRTEALTHSAVGKGEFV